MNETTSNLFNILVFAIMLACGILVGLDARKCGRTKAEAITWGVFAGWFIIIGPVFYLFFKSKFYK